MSLDVSDLLLGQAGSARHICLLEVFHVFNAVIGLPRDSLPLSGGSLREALLGGGG